MLRIFSPFAMLAGVILLLLVTPTIVGFYTDWLWFGEVGYQPVFTTMLRAQALLFLTAFVVAFAWLAFNVQVALRSMRHSRLVITTRDGIELRLPGPQQLRSLVLVVAMLLAVVVGLWASREWETWLLWRYAVPFGQADPILGYDVGFFVYSLPFLQFVRGLLQALVVLAALGSGAIYLLTGNLTSGLRMTFSMSPLARKHLSLLAAAFLLLLAFGAWIGRAEYLVQASAHIHGASYADVHARMPMALVLTAAAVMGAALAALHATTARRWPLPAAFALYVAVAAAGQIYGNVLQRLVVSPNEQALETPFIRHNIDATRRAFGLDGIEERQISGDEQLTRDDIARNADTLQNVRLWDHDPLLDTFGQLQVIRTYYDFEHVDNDRYRIDGTLRQVMLSARELNTMALPNKTWINERLTFTHGFGLTLGPVNQVTDQGLPVLFVKDIPPQTVPDLKIDEPSIYFGELSNDYVIVRTRTEEHHYPRGDKPVLTKYAGSGGVPIGSLWRKLLFAARFGSYQILLSNDIGPESRILFNRRIAQRINAVAPFLGLDPDPYLVLADGRLFWLHDAYTTSRLYPYSSPSPTARVNYIRNAVKFVIDAYNGTMTAYLADERDPIARTYARAFPGLFKPLSSMPPAIRAHVRYPEGIFGVQAERYATYHMTEPSVYYNREDLWQIPAADQPTAGRAAAMEPYYTIMRLPGEREAEFIQMLPFTPASRENLAAWLVARSDGEHYGRLSAFEFPKQKTVYGPRQMIARISQDQTISPQITLWNQQGSQVIWGTLMVIPVEESLIYVRPLYLRASGGRIPELTRVVVAYQDDIVMERTLDDAVARLFGGPSRSRPSGEEQTRSRDTASPPIEAPAGGELGQLAAEARAHYERAVQAQRAGDWAKYGEEITLLGQTLERMQRPGGQSPKR
ncbi:MAG TPA: UPF0182 family protein [Vicinamibacterales bacterium]|nr:UPF0182 family protein [Vicinamibacterales bacterium]